MTLEERGVIMEESAVDCLPIETVEYLLTRAFDNAYSVFSHLR
jgi:hypothetical protein